MCLCSTEVDGKRRDTSVCDGERQETTQKELFPMTNTKTKTSPAKAIAAVVIAVILAFTLVCLLTGNINPVCRVTAMLMPVWLAAELRLLCTLL